MLFRKVQLPDQCQAACIVYNHDSTNLAELRRLMDLQFSQSRLPRSYIFCIDGMGIDRCQESMITMEHIVDAELSIIDNNTHQTNAMDTKVSKKKENAKSTPTKKSTVTKKKKVCSPHRAKKSQAGPNGRAKRGIQQETEISDALANLLGQGKFMARTQIVKGIWAYIDKHNLKDPSNRQYIVFDGAMRDLFGRDRLHFCTMQKYINAHVHPFCPVKDNAVEDDIKIPRKKRTKQNTNDSSKQDAQSLIKTML